MDLKNDSILKIIQKIKHLIHMKDELFLAQQETQNSELRITT